MSHYKKDGAIFYERKYPIGSITRIKMKNFLTYDDVEVFPGPRLNLVIGPNGTGKSTMTHAISLACGGGTATVGRASDLSEFVKKDKTEFESFVEVDILTSPTLIQTIRRTINANNRQSFWTLNGNKSKESIVKELTASLHIDVNNLCSFMPQDKVGKFSRFSAREVLQETLKCIKSNTEPGKSMYDVQEELANQETIKVTREQEKTRKQAIIASLEEKITGLKAEVDRMITRKHLLHRLSLYEIKANLSLLDDIENDRETIQKELDTLNTSISQAQNIIAPIESKLRDYERQRMVQDKTNQAVTKKAKDMEKSLTDERDEADDIENLLYEVSQEVETMIRRRNTKEAELDTTIAKYNEMEKKYNDSLERKQNLQGLLDNLKQELREIQNNESQLSDHKDELTIRIRDTNTETNSLQHQINNLKDQNQLFANHLKRRGGYGVDISIRAMEEIQKLKDQNKFQQDVYGPIAKHIQIGDPVIGTMLESAIPERKLLNCYIVLNRHDYNVLQNEIKGKLKLSIDVVEMNNLTPIPNTFNNDVIDRLRHVGIKGYLIDQLQCPDIIRIYLYTYFNMSSTLWARSTSGDISDTDLTVFRNYPSFRLYVDKPSQRKVESFSGSRSKFNPNNVSTSFEEIVPKNIIKASQTHEDNDIDKQRQVLNQQINDKRQILSELTEDMSRCDTELNNVLRLRHENKHKRDQYTREMGLPEQLSLQLKSLEKKVKELKQQLAINIADQKDSKLHEYKKIMLNLLEKHKEISKLTNSHLDSQIHLYIVDIRRAQLNLQITNTSNELEESKGTIRALQLRKEQSKKLLLDIDQRHKRADDDLREKLLPYGGEENADSIFREVALLPETSTNDIKDRITQIELELQRLHDNPGAIQRYEELKEELLREKQAYNRIEEDFMNLEAKLNETSAGWRSGVENIRRKLDISFQTYMEELNFKGRIDLLETGKMNEWQFQMKVSFRESSDLANLSGDRHSGGERAVSTSMYLMALQALTNAPFRIVDEINQGMDENNERLVFDRVIQNCCKTSTSPQYYFVTPKLLPALKSMEDDNVTVLVICNGPGANVHWDLRAIMQELIRKNPSILSNADYLPNETDREDDSENNYDDKDTKPVMSQKRAIKEETKPMTSIKHVSTTSSSSSSSSSMKTHFKNPIQLAKVHVDLSQSDDEGCTSSSSKTIKKEQMNKIRSKCDDYFSQTSKGKIVIELRDSDDDIVPFKKIKM